MIRRKTGLVIDAYFSATKLQWILQNIRGARVRAKAGDLAFGTVDSWLIWNLTGGKLHITDASNASRTMLFNLKTGTWDEELLDLFGVPRKMLPEVKSSSEIIGQADFFSPSIPIAGIAGDQQAALFGQACTKPGMVKNTYGTGCFMLMHTGPKPINSKRQLVTSVAWKIGDKVEYALEGSVFIAGAVVQWLRDSLGLIRTSNEIESLAALVTDSGGVYLVPAFAGLGAPHWDQYARGLIAGITRGTTAAHLARAALEGIAYQVADILQVMEADAGMRLKELRVDGGGSQNDLLLQLQADLLRVPVVRPKVSETTALGAADGNSLESRRIRKARTFPNRFNLISVGLGARIVRKAREWEPPQLSTGGRVPLVFLCLLWSSYPRVLGQESTSPLSISGSDNVSQRPSSDQPAAAESAAASSSPSAPPPFGGQWNLRPKLSGDWWGVRDQFRDHGFTFDISSTTYYQGLVSGGVREPLPFADSPHDFQFGGRNDYIVNVDGQKAGLWQGFGIYLHGETDYGESPNLLTGAIVPVNIGRAHPAFFGTETALSAVKFTQALSENFIVWGGKINTIDNVQQPFMPGRGLDAGFMNAAFVWNPILGRTMNYATFGAGAAFLAGGQPVATLSIYDTHNATGTSSFEQLFDNGAIIYPTLTLPTTFFGMSGHQSLWGAYSSARYNILDQESLTIFPPPGLPPTTPVQGSWWIMYLFDQALWQDSSDATRSWGVFGNAGISDGKANPIHWSAVLGLGGSSPLACRKLDTFGVAYFYLGFTDRLKNLAPAVVPLRDERGVELFYNVGVTPWCHITADLQVITPVLERAEASLVFGLRMKIDF